MSRRAMGRRSDGHALDRREEGGEVSYDIDLVIDTGGPEPHSIDICWNYTSNCAPMWRAAGVDLAEFDGQPVKHCIEPLLSGINAMRRDPARFRAMNPPNGWGDYDTLLQALMALLRHFRAHPKATVEVRR